MEEIQSNIIIQGDALTELKKLPDESIDCCMSSPPYWALRDYGVEGQLGLEPTYLNCIKFNAEAVKQGLKEVCVC